MESRRAGRTWCTLPLDKVGGLVVVSPVFVRRVGVVVVVGHWLGVVRMVLLVPMTTRVEMKLRREGPKRGQCARLLQVPMPRSKE